MKYLLFNVALIIKYCNRLCTINEDTTPIYQHPIL